MTICHVYEHTYCKANCVALMTFCTLLRAYGHSLMCSCPHIRQYVFDIGLLVAWQFSLLFLKLDRIEVIFPSAQFFQHEKTAHRSFAETTRYIIHPSGPCSGAGASLLPMRTTSRGSAGSALISAVALLTHPLPALPLE